MFGHDVLVPRASEGLRALERLAEEMHHDGGELWLAGVHRDTATLLALRVAFATSGLIRLTSPLPTSTFP